MGKIAVTLQQALARRDRDGARRGTTSRVLAQGAGWQVSDRLCTLGPCDQPFEEQHTGVCIAMVVAGSFDYRAAPGRELLTPGALLLGNPGECFECGHRHGVGDRCIAFHYAPGYFERLAADAGVGSGRLNFPRARVASQRAFSPLIARACADASVIAGIDARVNTGTDARVNPGTDADAACDAVWDELAVELAAATLRAAGVATRAAAPVSATANARVAQIVRLIDDTPGEPHTLTSLAAAANLSEFYFLRTFQRVTGVTPHQYLLRTRLRAAALRLQDGGAKIVDIAFDCGFNDLSNFNHAFRAEFAVSPRAWPAQGSARRP
ncbi:DNA-binding domain-containing protein, AraC-type [Paraburkholderia ribeironis]|uniref:DNA-binding domain-containing protein, AraC-type n=1 Tax=Paraburkholderia ribeironis TaxID=1247936 RepID=A0A1N7S6Q9_9BURK|nr:AraC family transcriptional regulator [Paraburkholderia ribeironis]SIT43091.1 DNA-binding domain-containing protein, AraC-type [Paraburkholderia ribeironis]